MVIRNNEQGRYLRPTEAARELGISVKALRVYERAGLIEPDRSAKSWREYSPACMTRLRRILVMKSMGLMLAEIGKIIDAPGGDLSKLLEAQAQIVIKILEDERVRLRNIRAAQHRLAADPNSQLPCAILQPLAKALDAARVADIIRAIGNDDGLNSGDGVAAATSQSQAEKDLAEIVAEAGRLAATGGTIRSIDAIALARRWEAVRDTLSATTDLPSGYAVQNLADDIRLTPAIAPALRFLRDAVRRSTDHPEGKTR